jgi:hypothetical protein
MHDPGYPPTDVRRIHLRRIKSGSLLKLVLQGTTAVCGPLFILFGVMAAFGAGTVKFNEAPLTGAAGFFGALLMAPVFIGVISLFVWVAAYLGLRLAGWIKPLTLDYVPPEERS